MATITTDLICNLNQPVAATFLHGNLFSQDNAGNTINVYVMDNGVPATIGGTVSANVIRADGNTVAVSGAIEGNKAYVILPQACYAVPGRVEIIIKLTQSTTITTIAAIVANVYRSTTDTVVDPGTIIPSIQTLIAEIEEAVDSIPVDYSGLLATIAADYSSSKTYPVVGTYAWQGGVLKRNIVPITTAETYTAEHWTNVVLGDDVSALKSALESEQKNTFTVPTTYSYIWTTGSGVRPIDGANMPTSKQCRTGYNTIKGRMLLYNSNPDYEFVVWEYTENSVSSAVFSPTNKAFVDYPIIITEEQGATRFRIGVHRKDDADITNTDVAALGTAFKMYLLTDESLSIKGSPADAKAVKDECNSIRSDVQEYNAYNLLPHLQDSTIESAGLTGNVTNDVITVAGTTNAPFIINYYSSATALPDWWIPGKDVYLLFDVTGTGIKNLFIRILKYDGEGNTSVVADLNRSQTYHIPNDFDGVGLIIRFYIATGRTVNASVRPQILNAMTNAQLTQKVNQEDTFSNPPMLTIIDDDGNPKFYTELLPLIESKGVSISSAVIPYRANTGNQNHMTWEQIVDASCKGAEILNHSWNHLTGGMIAEMTAQEVWLNYQKARNTIESHGCNGGGYLVYAGASGSYAQAQEGAKLSNKCAFVSVGNKINYRRTLNRYDIKRFRVQTDGYDYDADKLKELIDICLANGGWMVWMIHTSETVWTTLNGLSAISDAIDYAIAQGLPIVSVETGYKTYIE